MAHQHHHHHEDPEPVARTTLVEERSNPAGIVLAIVGLVLAAFLLWLLAFSGLVFDRGEDTGRDVRIENQFENENPGTGDGTGGDAPQQQQPGDADTGTEGGPETGTNP